MTSAVPDGPGTAMDLLFGAGAGTPEALAQQILSAGADANLDRALKNLPPATRKAAVREAATQAAELLDVDLIGLLLAGWRKHRDLTSAARRTLAAPGSAELVDLIKHQITASQQPSVTILVDRRQVATVKLDLTVDFDIGAVVAGIKAGLLVAIHSGHCDATATLAIQETDVLTKHARFELPGVIPLSPGFRLLAAEDYSAGRGPGESAVPVTTSGRDDPGPTAPWWQRPSRPWGQRPSG